MYFSGWGYFWHIFPLKNPKKWLFYPDFEQKRLKIQFFTISPYTDNPKSGFLRLILMLFDKSGLYFGELKDFLRFCAVAVWGAGS